MVKDQMERPLTDDEAALCVAAIAWLKYEMIFRLSHFSPSPGILWDESQDNFQYGCSALGEASILEYMGHGEWRVLEGLEKDVTLPDGFTRNDLDNMLEAVAAHLGYHDDFWKVDEGTVPTTMLSDRLCKSLVMCNYMVVGTDSRYFWTEKFAPWLVRHGEWDLADFVPAEDSKVDALIELIPKEDMDTLSFQSNWGRAFVHTFFGHWRDNRWSPSFESGNVPHDGWDLSLAAGLYQRLNRTDA
jgi:hypothetical protein